MGKKSALFLENKVFQNFYNSDEYINAIFVILDGVYNIRNVWSFITTKSASKNLSNSRELAF